MKPDELKRLGKILKKHLNRWGGYYLCSGGVGFIVGAVLLMILAPKPGSITASDTIISIVVGTLGFSVAAVNQSVAWVRSFSERRHKKKLRRLREVKKLEAELGLDNADSEMVH